MSDLPLSYTVSVAEVPSHGLDVELTPTAEQRAALARHVGLLEVPRFIARLSVKPEGADGIRVTGTVDAAVVQTCGVTLEPFEAPLEEAVDVHFVPAGTPLPEHAEEDEEFDPPDEIVDGGIDLGALAVEFLALGIDPYPRKPGAVFEPPAEDSAAASPFSALARLKGENDA
ncbi:MULTISPECIES: YceD family protein [unclassified Xanthobacter]|uniref:YceD family protein n=1 Tax=unclassified Xanthobacter TaxID=2623496 RepID=UPI001EDEC5DC|nr:MULTISPECIES: DUF177 domain-containing protein [unclassified Xanthobacter]